MKRAYIHIGLAKTGTTSLQQFLRTNENLLKARGFSYLCDPRKPYYVWHAHFPVAACFFSERPDFISPEKFKPAGEVLGELRRDTEACPEDIILSCEHFSYHLKDVEAIRAIGEALPNRDIRVICYLRRQDEFALALYSTYIKTGGRTPFVSQGIHPRTREYNFRGILELWGSVFGHKNIIVRDHARRHLAGGDIRYDFLKLLDIDPHGFVVGDDQNLSLDAKQIEALRMINAYLPTSAEANWAQFTLANEIRNTILPLLPTGAPLPSLLSVKQRNDIMMRFENDNRRVAEEFANAEFILDWHEPADSEESAAGPTILTKEDLAETVAKLGRKLVSTKGQPDGRLLMPGSQ